MNQWSAQYHVKKIFELQEKFKLYLSCAHYAYQIVGYLCTIQWQMQMEELKDNENLPRRSRLTVMVDAMTTELQIGSSDAASCKTLANIF